MPRVEWSFLLPAEDHKQVKKLMAYSQSRLTPWGQILFVISIIGSAVSSIGTQISAYFIPSFILALLITSYLLSLFFRPKVTTQRLLPPTPSAGGHCVYKVIVKNIGKRPIRHLTIHEQSLPYGLYTDMHHPQFNNTIEWLEPGDKSSVTLAFRIPRRGSFDLSPLIAGSYYPSGILRSRRKIGKIEKFLVYPQFIKKKGVYTDLHREFQPGGISMSSRIGDSNEFASTREYRQGDRLRDVHWNSSARTGKLIVREYVEEYFTRVGLFLDTELLFFEKHKCFEDRISLCAGTADILKSSNYMIDLFLSDNEYQHLQIGRGIEHFNHLFDLLSIIEGDRKVNFPTASNHLQEHGRQLSILILFLKDWDQERSLFVQQLNEYGTNIRTIIVRDQATTIPINDDSVTLYTTKQLNENE